MFVQVQTNRIPTEGLKLRQIPRQRRPAQGPNQQNPDRGIETVHQDGKFVWSEEVQTNRIPTEGLKQ